MSRDFDTADHQALLGALDASWQERVSELLENEDWAAIWSLAPQSPPARCCELMEILSAHAWRPDDPQELANYNVLTDLSKNVAREEKGTRGLSPRVLPCSRRVDQLVFTPDGRYAVTGHSGNHNDNELRLWTLEPWALLKSVELSFPPHLLAISHDGGTLAAGCYQNLRLWKVPELEHIRELSPLSKGPTSITFTAFGKYILACGMEGMIRSWNIEDINFFARLKVPGDSVSELSCDPSGRFLAATGSRGKVMIWHLPSGDLVREFNAHKRLVNQVHFSLNGQVLLTAGEDFDIFESDNDEDSNGRFLRCWNMNDWTPLNEVSISADQIASTQSGDLVAALGPQSVDPDIPYFQTLSNLNPSKVTIWDSFLSTSIAEFDLGEIDWSNKIVFSVDGQYLAGIGGTDGICLWPRGFGMLPELTNMLQTIKQQPICLLSANEFEYLGTLIKSDWIPSPLRSWVRLLAKQVAICNHTDLDLLQILLPVSDQTFLRFPKSHCPSCNDELSLEARFCGSCGKSVFGFAKLQTKRCRACSEFILSTVTICSHCGDKVSEAQQSTRMRKTKTTHKGTCQQCGCLVTVDASTGLIKEHDYPRSWKFLDGPCTGAGHCPYEQGMDLLKQSSIEAAKEAARLRQDVDDIISNPGPSVMRDDRSKEPPLLSSFTLTADNMHIWRCETGCRQLQDAIERYNSWYAYPFEKQAREKEAYALWQTKRVEDWKHSQLLTTKDKQALQYASKAKTSAIRSAKRTIADRYGEASNEFYSPHDSLDFEEIFAAEAAARQQEALAAAKTAFRLGSRGLECHIWNFGQSFRRNVYTLRDLIALYHGQSELLSGVTCMNCGGSLCFQMGELSCNGRNNDYSFESREIITSLSAIAKAFRRGDEVVHLRTVLSPGPTCWHEVRDWKTAHSLVSNPHLTNLDLYCSKCKAPMEVKFGDVRCECFSMEGEIIGDEECQELASGSLMESLKKFKSDLFRRFTPAHSHTRISELEPEFDSEILDPRSSIESDPDDLNEPESDGSEDDENDSQKLNLLELAPGDIGEFEIWLCHLGVCDGYDNLPSL